LLITVSKIKTDHFNKFTLLYYELLLEKYPDSPQNYLLPFHHVPCRIFSTNI
jgi:hypothetical protein